jgi:integral membrane protein
MQNNSLLNTFFKVAIAEGWSFIAFGLTMPLKYAFQIPLPNKIVGWLHGIIFIIYCVLLLIVGLKHKWSFIKLALSYIASLIPFGTFIAAKKVYGKNF